jgi:hypothetical protein
MYERMFRDWGSRGSLAEVWIDKDAGLCKKYFKLNGVTFRGTAPVIQDPEKLIKLYQAEIKWSTTLPKDTTIQVLEYGELTDEFGFYLIQEYLGPDLLTYYTDKTLHSKFPDITTQVENIFKTYQEHGVYKFNNALSNLTGFDGKIKAFDFKWMKTRDPLDRHKEIRSVTDWISKIDSGLCFSLPKYI